MTLKYGQELLNEIKLPNDQLTADINDLIAERDKLQTDLDKTKNAYTLDVIKKNETKEQQLSRVEKALERAWAEKTKLINGDAEANHDKVMALIHEIAAAEANAQDETYRLIMQKMAEITALYDAAQEYDNQVVTDARAMVYALQPYLPEDVYAKLDKRMYPPFTPLHFVKRPEDFMPAVIAFKERLNN